MVESRWFRRAGPAVIALGAIALIATTTVGAPGRAWTPEACAGLPRIGDAASGSWYRIDPVIGAGTRTGQRLVLGRAGERSTRALDLDAESFAAGPFGGMTLIGSDDGHRSQLSLIDATRGCAWPLVATSDVVRTATLASDGATLYEFRVDRKTRADLGVWRRALDGTKAPSRVLPPIAADARFGRTWITTLSWGEDGRSLAVQSCGEIACRVRILDTKVGGVQRVADPALGDLVGLGGHRLVAHGACRGLPCPLLSVDVVTGSTLILDPIAGQAVLSRDAEGRPVVVHEVGADGDHLRVVGLDGHGPRMLDGDPEGRRLVADPARSGSGAEHDPGWLLFGPDGRLPIDGSLRPLLRHVLDGRTVHLDEVSR
jgi:hypothetical protein